MARRPSGAPQPTDFDVIDAPNQGRDSNSQLRVRVIDLSLDPFVRSLLGEGHMEDGPLPIGAVIPGRALAEVVDSDDPSRPVGSLVVAETGWRSEAVVPAAEAAPVEVPAGVAPSAALGLLGMPGLTAYAAHRRHVQPQVGDTVVVSAATGGVGALAGTLARLAGSRTIAVVGSRTKAEVAIEQLGYDDAVVRAEQDWVAALHAACPHRIDGYYHMADQSTLDPIMERLAIGARVSLIGAMDQYNGATPTRMRIGAVMSARAEVHGMVVYDHVDLSTEHRRRVGRLLAEGVITPLEDRYKGLTEAPEAFCRLMAGTNTGKVIVEVGHRSR